MAETTINPKNRHIFTFPFKWNFKPKGKSLEVTDFSTRTSVNNFHKILSFYELNRILLDLGIREKTKFGYGRFKNG